MPTSNEKGQEQKLLLTTGIRYSKCKCSFEMGRELQRFGLSYKLIVVTTFLNDRVAPRPSFPEASPSIGRNLVKTSLAPGEQSELGSLCWQRNPSIIFIFIVVFISLENVSHLSCPSDLLVAILQLLKAGP